MKIFTLSRPIYHITARVMWFFLFCGLKEKDKLQNEILNKKKTLIYKKTNHK